MPDLEVADALLPIKEKLDSIIARLEKIRGSGSTRWESLGPFQDELRAIDELYVDEKFVVDGKIPEGQAILAGLLNDAHELYHECLEICEDADDGKDGDDDDDDGEKGGK